MSAQSMAIAYRTSRIAYVSLNRYLDSLGVKADVKTIRTSVLTNNDKNFIKRVLRDKPQEIDLTDLSKGH